MQAFGYINYFYGTETGIIEHEDDENSVRGLVGDDINMLLRIIAR